MRMDPLLLLASLGLVACSLITLKGASAHDWQGDPLHYVKRQAVYAAVGLVLMFVVARLDYSRLRELRYPLYGSMIFSIIAVLGLAKATNGAKSWIELPGFNL